MDTGFLTVPDWRSWENQGGNVASADLTGNGHPDLVVFQIDNPPGPNHGLYKIGRDLDMAGGASGGWTDWQEVPDWQSWENQGGAIALADLEGAGHIDLLVFQIDNPPGLNRGLYRVGHHLAQDGTVQGGWGPWMMVPDWNSWENQGGGIAVWDINADGHPDLVVFQIDNPMGRNNGLYRIGWNLGSDGTVQDGWSPWMEVPGWLSWEDQGGGIALTDLDNNGRPELIVCGIDNPFGLNAGEYAIGWNLDVTGRAAGNWSPWVTVPDWMSWEDAGGGIALSKLDPAAPRPQIIIFHIDSPQGLNQGLYRVLDLVVDLDNAPDKGLWRLLSYDSQILPVHAALLHNNKVLFFAGSGNSPTRFTSPIFGDVAQGIYCSVVWEEAAGNSFDHPATVDDPVTFRPIDFFCGGESFLPDGRLLVAGGTLQYDPFFGRRDALVFDPTTNQWTPVAKMARGRWYPTLLTLGDGRVLAASGSDEQGHVNDTLETYSDATGWVVQRDVHLPFYPHLFLLHDGRIFQSGGQMDTPADAAPLIFELANTPEVPVNGLSDVARRNQSASVLMPPAQHQQVMIIGGGPEDESIATSNVDLVDLTAQTPAYHPSAPLNHPRMHLNAVLLPDRTVLVCGGSGQRENALEATLNAEIYDPEQQPPTWTVMAAAAIPRMYHSVALLLPDGRVVAAGSNPERGSQVQWIPPDRFEELRLEIYSPPYLFKGARPVMGPVDQQWHYNTNVQIPTPQAADIRWVSLIRAGVTTHAFNNEQRLVDLEIVQHVADALIVTVTNNPNLAPPGWYMLFITDNARVPSIATWIQLVHA